MERYNAYAVRKRQREPNYRDACWMVALTDGAGLSVNDGVCPSDRLLRATRNTFPRPNIAHVRPQSRLDLLMLLRRSIAIIR